MNQNLDHRVPPFILTALQRGARVSFKPETVQTVSSSYPQRVTGLKPGRE